jgi:Ni,Fe-hydrogenase I cytochrome b subunit
MAPASAAGFAMMSISGYLMFASAATKYVENPSSQVKMTFYFLAIVTHSLIYIKVFRTREERSKGLWALSGLALMLLWLGVGVAGRAIAFI